MITSESVESMPSSSFGYVWSTKYRLMGPIVSPTPMLDIVEREIRLQNTQLHLGVPGEIPHLSLLIWQKLWKIDGVELIRGYNTQRYLVLVRANVPEEPQM